MFSNVSRYYTGNEFQLRNYKSFYIHSIVFLCYTPYRSKAKLWMQWLRGAFSNVCPFAFKARSTTLIFVECITFHQTSLLDDVHKILAVFIGHKLCVWYVFEFTPHILKYSRSGLTLTLKLPA